MNKLNKLNIYNYILKIMNQETLNKVDKSIELLKEVYEYELMNGGDRHDFRLISLLDVIKKVASWRKRCNLSTNSCSRLAKW